MSDVVLIHHTNPIGACYLARRGTRLLAGRSPDTAKEFRDSQAVLTHFRPMADLGLHWAWNLCYFVEDDVSEE